MNRGIRDLIEAMRMSWKIGAFLVGVNAILTQVLIIRELLVNFSGNELSMGIILSCWLVGGAIGSLLIARILIGRAKETADVFIMPFLILSISAPLFLFLSRIAKTLLHIPVYEIAGPLQILAISALLLAPPGCILSFCFISLCKIAKESKRQINTLSIIYIMEALGAFVAGAVFTFVLVGRFSPFCILLTVGAINCLFLIFFSTIFKKRPYIPILSLTILCSLLLLNFPRWLEKKSQAMQWHPQPVSAYLNSKYGNITVTKVGDTFNVYENGSLFFTTQDEAANEEFANLVMLQHPNPQGVLLIGGGVGGLLKPLLEHNPKKITYLELDPLLIKTGKDFVSEEDRDALLSHSVNIEYADARFFLKRAKEKFDIIIINLPDPLTLQLNRFYTKEFYNQARSHLKEKGILVTHISSKESIISNELARYNASVYKTLKSVFSFVEPVPGERLILISSDNEDIRFGRPDILIKRFNERNIRTRFLTPYHIKDRYYPATMSYLTQRLAQQLSTAKLNSDFAPVCFYYYIVLWSIQFHPALAGFFGMIATINIFDILVAVLLLFLAGLFIIKTKKESRPYIISFATAANGAIAITLEIIIILSFQISYGYVYGKVGFLISLFMLGLALGGYIINRMLKYASDYIILFSYIVLILAIYTLSVPFIIGMTRAIPLESVQLIFYLMIFIAGIFVGGGFPAGVAALHTEKTTVYSTSIIWGSDLLGATIGTLVFSLIIMPVFGIFQAAFLGALLSFASFILLYLFRQRLQR